MTADIEKNSPVHETDHNNVNFTFDNDCNTKSQNSDTMSQNSDTMSVNNSETMSVSKIDTLSVNGKNMFFTSDTLSIDSRRLSAERDYTNNFRRFRTSSEEYLQGLSHSVIITTNATLYRPNDGLKIE